MSRRRIAALLVLVASSAWPARAQDGATGSPPERIDLTITAPPMRSTEEACARQREAAIVTGEIVVCGREDVPDQRITSKREAQDRYAAATAFRDAPATPDVAGPGIFRGKATFSLPPPVPALIIDVRALPEAPPGSDADRVARGLAPLGGDGREAPRELTAQERAELGLPEPAPAAASRAGSAAPAAPQ